MGAVWIRVAGVLDDGHVAGVELGLERGKGGVKANLVVELEGSSSLAMPMVGRAL